MQEAEGGNDKRTAGTGRGGSSSREREGNSSVIRAPEANRRVYLGRLGCCGVVAQLCRQGSGVVISGRAGGWERLEVLDGLDLQVLSLSNQPSLFAPATVLRVCKYLCC